MVDAIRRAASLAAIRRGSSKRICLLDKYCSDNNASGTTVVLPEPGGAVIIIPPDGVVFNALDSSGSSSQIGSCGKENIFIALLRRHQIFSYCHNYNIYELGNPHNVDLLGGNGAAQRKQSKRSSFANIL
jgi:hypothetical protein